MRNGETTLRHLLAPIQDVLDDPVTTEIVTSEFISGRFHCVAFA